MLGWLFKKKTTPKWTLNLDESVPTNSATAWVTYAGIKALMRNGQYFEDHPDRVGQTSAFHEELFARDGMAEFWSIQRDELQATDPYLMFMVQVRNSGFMAEYVWQFLSQPSWPTPHGLRLSEFKQWLLKNGHSSHRPATHAFLSAA